MEQIFGKTAPAVVKDPFKSDCIRAIHMHANKDIFTGALKFSASVQFENGETKGEQGFTAKSFDELYIKVAEFCKSLSVKEKRYGNKDRMD